MFIFFAALCGAEDQKDSLILAKWVSGTLFDVTPIREVRSVEGDLIQSLDEVFVELASPLATVTNKAEIDFVKDVVERANKPKIESKNLPVGLFSEKCLILQIEEVILVVTIFSGYTVIEHAVSVVGGNFQRSLESGSSPEVLIDADSANKLEAIWKNRP